MRRESAAVVGLSIEKVFRYFSAKVTLNFYGKKITSASPQDGLFADWGILISWTPPGGSKPRCGAVVLDTAHVVRKSQQFLPHESCYNPNSVVMAKNSVLTPTSPPAVSATAPNILFRLRFSPFLTQMVVIRRCNLSCGYCSEYDKSSEPVPVQVLEDRLRKLKELGTFGISLTGGEPTLHPDLPRIIRTCRELRFYRTSMITNGFFLNPEMIETLNQAGLQKMQISIDGVHGNETTQKVLNNLKKRLQWLRDHARFPVVISSVIGASPPEEAEEVVSFALKMGFSSRVLLVHDSHGQIKLNAKEIKTFQKIVDMLPRRWPELSSYRKRLIHTGSAPFKCRAGSRYLYVDEYGRVNWCSQTRTVWSKALMDYTPNDLREQFYNYKPCHATCTLNCSRSNSYFDNWRRQPGFSS